MKIIIIDPRTRCPWVPKRGTAIPGPPACARSWEAPPRVTDRKRGDRKATKPSGRAKQSSRYSPVLHTMDSIS
jgi:hypothetical protein